MFSCDPLLLLQSTLENGIVNWIVALELAMDLGMLGEAEKIAGEIMEKMGPYPEILRRRALILIARGDTGAGAVYLRKLSRMPFYRQEAARLLRLLDRGGAVYSEPRIAAMRGNRDTVDYLTFNGLPGDVILGNLLQSSQGNKMAFDYLMTWCLLTHRLDAVAALAPAAPAFGYDALPRPWEEALCLYRSVKSMEAPSGVAFNGIRPETVERLSAFSQAWLRVENDPKAAETLSPAFGDSYFYYSVFRYCRGDAHE
jgi:hypothetical protein